MTYTLKDIQDSLDFLDKIDLATLCDGCENVYSTVLAKFQKLEGILEDLKANWLHCDWCGKPMTSDEPRFIHDEELVCEDCCQ